MGVKAKGSPSAQLAGRKTDLDAELEAAPQRPAPPDAAKAKVSELSAYASQWGFPGGEQGWKALAAKEKRVAFARMYAPETVSTDTFDAADPIQVLANQAENITPEQVQDRLVELSKSRGENDFLIGGILSQVVARSLFRQWGFDTFREWVHARTEFAVRKANYLVRNYNRLLELGIPFSRFGGVGWQKVNMLLGVVNQENVDTWAEKAKGLDVASLDEEIQSARRQAAPGDGSKPESGSKMHQKAFKLHADQKETVDNALEQMKEELPTEHDNVALEAICAQFLSGSLGEGTATPALKLDTLDDCAGALVVAFTRARELQPNTRELWTSILPAIEELFEEDCRIDVTPFED